MGGRHMHYTLLHTLSNLVLAQTFWSFFSTDCSHSCLSYDPICQQNQTHIKTQQLQKLCLFPLCLCPKSHDDETAHTGIQQSKNRLGGGVKREGDGVGVGGEEEGWRGGGGWCEGGGVGQEGVGVEEGGAGVGGEGIGVKGGGQGLEGRG